jgi:hypothetical protein
MPSRKIYSCLLVAVMAAAIVSTGCHGNGRPGGADVVIYQQWETETHRPHVDLEQRNQDEQKEYSDWRQKHDDHR